MYFLYFTAYNKEAKHKDSRVKFPKAERLCVHIHKGVHYRYASFHEDAVCAD